MSPQSALVRTWLRLLRSIIDAETALVHVRASARARLRLFPRRLQPQDLRVLSLAFYRPFIYEVVRQKRLASNPGRSASSSSSTTGEWLSNEDVSFLFGNLETVYSIHASFLTSLERQFSLWPNPGWGGFAGAFRMFFNALRTVLSSLGTSPQRLARIAFERLSALPEFQTLLKQVGYCDIWMMHQFGVALAIDRHVYICHVSCVCAVRGVTCMPWPHVRIFAKRAVYEAGAADKELQRVGVRLRC